MSIKTASTVLTLLLLGGASLPGQQQDVKGSKDHPLISRYPGSVIHRYLQKEFDQYNLPLSRMSPPGKVEKTQRLEGKVTRIY